MSHKSNYSLLYKGDEFIGYKLSYSENDKMKLVRFIKSQIPYYHPLDIQEGESLYFNY